MNMYRVQLSLPNYCLLFNLRALRIWISPIQEDKVFAIEQNSANKWIEITTNWKEAEWLDEFGDYFSESKNMFRQRIYHRLRITIATENTINMDVSISLQRLAVDRGDKSPGFVIQRMNMTRSMSEFLLETITDFQSWYSIQVFLTTVWATTTPQEKNKLWNLKTDDIRKMERLSHVLSRSTDSLIHEPSSLRLERLNLRVQNQYVFNYDISDRYTTFLCKIDELRPSKNRCMLFMIYKVAKSHHNN